MFNLKLNNPELDQKSRIIYAGLFFFAISIVKKPSHENETAFYL
ncbi:hypothetical protein SAMN05216311_115148 [Chitinophaga sp. CF418]|nr:hypothetical protein SAMN05216311_115148 [Chitinophaga sp. CF418]